MFISLPHLLNSNSRKNRKGGKKTVLLIQLQRISVAEIFAERFLKVSLGLMAKLQASPQREEVGCRSRVGLAMSQDGRNWARIEANHHTGALFDAGEEGEWDEVLNGAPQVMSRE